MITVNAPRDIPQPNFGVFAESNGTWTVYLSLSEIPADRLSTLQAPLNSKAERQAAYDAAESFFKNLLDDAQTAITQNDTFLAIASPSNAQTLQQVQRITNQNQRIIRALLRLINRERDAL